VVKALRRTYQVLRSLPRDRVSVHGVLAAVRGLHWVLRHRQPLPPFVEQRFLALERSQVASKARRCVS
jgi:N-acetylglucosaminyl-diphospho-decaprenol L-rhamnosyltransferase